MPLLNFDALRARGETRMREVLKSVDAYIDDENHERERFDVFLSHAFKDAKVIVGIKETLEDLGLTVYVDWLNDPDMSRTEVTFNTAFMLRRRMQACTSLIYAVTDNASTSLWMPWELGYFDGLKQGKVAVLPVATSSNEKYKGREYLCLYPYIDVAGIQKRDGLTLWVNGGGKAQSVNRWLSEEAPTKVINEDRLIQP